MNSGPPCAEEEAKVWRSLKPCPNLASRRQTGPDLRFFWSHLSDSSITSTLNFLIMCSITVLLNMQQGLQKPEIFNSSGQVQQGD